MWADCFNCACCVGCTIGYCKTDMNWQYVARWLDVKWWRKSNSRCVVWLQYVAKCPMLSHVSVIMLCIKHSYSCGQWQTQCIGHNTFHGQLCHVCGRWIKYCQWLSSCNKAYYDVNYEHILLKPCLVSTWLYILLWQHSYFIFYHIQRVIPLRIKPDITTLTYLYLSDHVGKRRNLQYPPEWLPPSFS